LYHQQGLTALLSCGIFQRDSLPRIATFQSAKLPQLDAMPIRENNKMSWKNKIDLNFFVIFCV
jgi:hypothetical protein